MEGQNMNRQLNLTASRTGRIYTSSFNWLHLNNLVIDLIAKRCLSSAICIICCGCGTRCLQLPSAMALRGRNPVPRLALSSGTPGGGWRSGYQNSLPYFVRSLCSPRREPFPVLFLLAPGSKYF